MQILCGNGTLEPAFEECDDGNSDDGDGCSAVCTIEECGNDILDYGEECDDGGNIDCDGCSAACLEEFCGDGITCASQPKESSWFEVARRKRIVQSRSLE